MVFANHRIGTLIELVSSSAHLFALFESHFEINLQNISTWARGYMFHEQIALGSEAVL